jgi:phage-related protein
MIKTLKWVGSSLKELLGFPDEVKREIGYALHVAQEGKTHETVKMFKGSGSGVRNCK